MAPCWRFLLFCCLLSVSTPALALNVERFSPSEKSLHKKTLKILKPFVDRQKPDGAMNLLTFEELYAPLPPEGRDFLDAIRAINPKTLGATAHAFEAPPPDILFVKLPRQQITRQGVPVFLPRQYLPQEVYHAYWDMAETMEKDLGKTLYVESGYRSPAYQLYLFLYYLPKHGYSIRENNRFVALPGHSEHGAPDRQAVDFINAEGINGEDNPEEFEALPEYRWLTRHAREYGFFLSYPRENAWGTSFEPWHWHYEKR